MEHPMRNPLLAALVATTAFSVTEASACGPDTAALMRRVPDMAAAPAFRCGTHFNDALARAQKKDWKGALAAYEAHLATLGKWQAGSADADATLTFLRRMAAAG
jgi:hypothetical protein